MTIRTYDLSAEALAADSSSVGPRNEDISRGFDMVNRTQPHVVEIGCGDGRDAELILAKTPHYIGMDISAGMLELARKRNPEGRFMWGDIAKFDLFRETDIVFSFASLLHVPKEDTATFFERAHSAMSPDGIIYISTTVRQVYTSEITTDQFGERLFYHYTPELIKELAGVKYRNEYLSFEPVGTNWWFTMALRKQ